MGPIKIMPCLDMKEGRVVKGIHFVDLKDAGDPVQNAAFYQREGADELAMLDIAATVENRKTRLEWIKAVSEVIDIPLTVGGGISTLEDIQLVLEAGADKISMNSAAVKDPGLVKRAAEEFGTERVTVAIDARRNAAMPSGFELVVSGGTKPMGKDAVAWARECEALGAGVILPPAWMATERRQAMIWHSPRPSPKQSRYRWWHQGARESWSTSMMPLCRQAPRYSWLLRYSTSAS